MDVKPSYYFFFSLKLLFSGFLVGYIFAVFVRIILSSLAIQMFISDIFLYLIPLISIFYMYEIYRFFWGGKRGEFEYAYLEYLTKKAITSSILKLYGKKVGFKFYYSTTIPEDEDYCSEDERSKLISGNEHKFYLLLRDAKFAIKKDSMEKAKGFLQAAIKIKPDDVYANYMLGTVSEYVKQADRSLSAYNKALENVPIALPGLKEYIWSQIERIRTKGILKEPPKRVRSWY